MTVVSRRIVRDSRLFENLRLLFIKTLNRQIRRILSRVIHYCLEMFMCKTYSYLWFHQWIFHAESDRCCPYPSCGTNLSSVTSCDSWISGTAMEKKVEILLMFGVGERREGRKYRFTFHLRELSLNARAPSSSNLTRWKYSISTFSPRSWWEWNETRLTQEKLPALMCDFNRIF